MPHVDQKYTHTLRQNMKMEQVNPGPLLVYGSFQVIKFFIEVLNLIVDPLFGYSFTKGFRKERLLANNEFQKSAHLVRIIARQSLVNHDVKDTRNFLYTHIGESLLLFAYLKVLKVITHQAQPSRQEMILESLY